MRQPQIAYVVRALTCIIAIVSWQSAIWAQTAYSIASNNALITSRNQQLYRINVLNGDTSYIGDLVSPSGERVIREYEGLASIGSALYGVSEFVFGTGGGETNCNTGWDPWTGISSDIRKFRVFSEGSAHPTAPSGPQQVVPSPGNPAPAQVALPNGQNTNAGPQIGETCINSDDGGEDIGAAYNQGDGFIWAISSNSNFSAQVVRTRLYRISPSTGLAQRMCTIGNADFSVDGGDEFPFLDGMTIFPTGGAYATEARFSVDPNVPDADNRDFGGLYLIPLPTGPVGGGDGACEADFIKHLFPQDANVGTGLAHNGNSLYILLDYGTVYETTVLPGAPVLFRAAMSTPGATTGAFGGDADGFGPGSVAEGRIEGCRGFFLADPEFQEGLSPLAGGCKEFRGFDIPNLGGR